MHNPFRFKQFLIHPHDCGMPVSTDGVLLGAWADSRTSSKVLDIGTGTGLIALMMAQRFPHNHITAIDIDADAIDAANKNFRCSPWKDRLITYHENVTQWEPFHQFDIIVCNPPYFNHGMQSQSSKRARARHTDNLPFLDLINAVNRLLHPKGTAHFILPCNEATRFIALAEEHGLSYSRLTQVQSTKSKPFSRYLFSLERENTEIRSPLHQSSLCIHEGDQYSADFIALTKDFYLKM